ncbi:hypothetical protein E2P81_ATG00286 [Venturia nashicola]|uniref:Uncharacterized protein n=1 Tax=Venturia nashicola TaxID=86259 RepID=A0A4Z1PDF6_9PEZI|nr:hypothetical protein E6O75_ATG00298 [Venturia nashicola]TLD39299.1 hypothetical protein E2P81_ATG00286 [Venturia nashicola]
MAHGGTHLVQARPQYESLLSSGKSPDLSTLAGLLPAGPPDISALASLLPTGLSDPSTLESLLSGPLAASFGSPATSSAVVQE